MNKSQTIIVKGIGIAIAIAGIILIIPYIGFRGVIGLGCLFWANNISQDFRNCNK